MQLKFKYFNNLIYFVIEKFNEVLKNLYTFSIPIQNCCKSSTQSNQTKFTNQNNINNAKNNSYSYNHTKVNM